MTQEAVRGPGAERVEPEPRKNKVAKYRAKFDPRATKQPYAIKMIETKYREGREDRVYMVMELATGGELFDRIIAKGSFTERDATRVLQMVLDGVRYLHTLGITHRDLKPENLLYYHPGTDSKIMITDFGLASARKKGDDCLMKTTCGTPEYIAPEILVRKPYTNSVDMWALGVISYILLSGTMPFEDDNRTRLYRQILKGKYSYSGEGFVLPWGSLQSSSVGSCAVSDVPTGVSVLLDVSGAEALFFLRRNESAVTFCIYKGQCPWPSVSNLAKDFIDRLLTVDPSDRMTALQALKHPWVVSMASSSSMKNLHRSISQNLLKRASSRCQSTKSAQSTRSSRSTKSNKSRRVRERELRELNLRYQQQYTG
ncbi:UNVERIFIED_CONTAM: hypothetical protein H355_000155 [Colinus virginianus]|nr:hypothetical protein H355_000155 [Colinus virginianus]